MPAKKKLTPSQKTNSIVQVAAVPKRDIVVPLLVGAIIVAAFAVGYLYGKVSVYDQLGVKPGTAEGVEQAQEVAPEVTLDQVKALFADKSNLVFGNPESKVLFVEFSDPSCPYCHVATGKNPELNQQVGERFILTTDGGSYVAPVPEMKRLVDEGKAAYVWFYSPGAGAGEVATQAFYCAHEQGKFWQVHDLLMSNDGYTLVRETVGNDIDKASEMATFLSGVVDARALQTCLESGTHAARIQSDTALSRQLGVQGTPGFFVNNKSFPGAYSFTEMEPEVEQLLK